MENMATLSVIEEQLESISCQASHSSPAPTFSWQMNGQKMSSVQGTNSSEKTESTLQQSFTRSASGQKLKCVVSHPGYPGGEKVMTVILDVMCK